MLLMTSMPSAEQMKGIQSRKVIWTVEPLRGDLENTEASMKKKKRVVKHLPYNAVLTHPEAVAALRAEEDEASAKKDKKEKARVQAAEERKQGRDRIKQAKREATALAKTQTAADPLTDAPTEVSEQQLREVHIRVRTPVKTN